MTQRQMTASSSMILTLVILTGLASADSDPCAHVTPPWRIEICKHFCSPQGLGCGDSCTPYIINTRCNCDTFLKYFSGAAYDGFPCTRILETAAPCDATSDVKGLLLPTCAHAASCAAAGYPPDAECLAGVCMLADDCEEDGDCPTGMRCSEEAGTCSCPRYE